MTCPKITLAFECKKSVKLNVIFIPILSSLLGPGVNWTFVYILGAVYLGSFGLIIMTAEFGYILLVDIVAYFIKKKKKKKIQKSKKSMNFKERTRLEFK